jgi:hypothetical protein
MNQKQHLDDLLTPREISSQLTNLGVAALGNEDLTLGFSFDSS